MMMMMMMMMIIIISKKYCSSRKQNSNLHHNGRLRWPAYSYSLTSNACAVSMCRTLTFEMASVACTWLHWILDLTNVGGTLGCFVLMRFDDRSNHDSFATFNKSELRNT